MTEEQLMAVMEAEMEAASTKVASSRKRSSKRREGRSARIEVDDPAEEEAAPAEEEAAPAEEEQPQLVQVAASTPLTNKPIHIHGFRIHLIWRLCRRQGQARNRQCQQ